MDFDEECSRTAEWLVVLSLLSPLPASPPWFTPAGSCILVRLPCASSAFLLPGQSCLPWHLCPSCLACLSSPWFSPAGTYTRVCLPSRQTSESVPRARVLSMHGHAWPQHYSSKSTIPGSYYSKIVYLIRGDIPFNLFSSSHSPASLPCPFLPPSLPTSC